MAGISHSGVLKFAGEREIELASSDGKTIRITRANIDEITSSRKSLMPDNLHATLSPSEFADLETLRLPPPTAGARPDNPDVIARATRPARVVPFVTAGDAVQRPVWFGPLIGKDGAYLAVEIEPARIWRIESAHDGVRKHLFVDLHDQTRYGYIEGILGFALYREFARNRRYFVAMHDPARDKVVVNVCERRANKDGTAAKGLSEGTVALRVYHDEDAEVYLNGVAAARPRGFVGGYVDLPIEDGALRTLTAGKNTIAVHGHQIAGGQYIDAGIVQLQSAPAKTK